MTQRRVDLALLVGIGVLLVLILVLALSAAPRSAPGDIGDPALTRPPAGAAEGRLTETPADHQAGPVEEAAEVPATQPEPQAETSATGSAPVDSAVSDSVAPVPGAVEVGRIGFAYATGTSGACGVPLTAWAFVALSRDLLAKYPCGTAVTLTLEDEVAGRREVTAQVGDTMGAEITDTVNIFVAEDEPALEYGVTSGTLTP